MQRFLILLLIFSSLISKANNGNINDSVPTGFPQNKWAGWSLEQAQMVAIKGYGTSFLDTTARPTYPSFIISSIDSSMWIWDMTKWSRNAKASELYSLPNGLNGQVPYYNLNDSNSTTAADILNVGKFIYDDDQLDSMKTTHAAQIDIFNKWKRFAFGGRGGAGNQGVAALNDTIPNRPDATNSFQYDATNNLVKSTFNTGANVGFYNNIFSKSYEISGTVSALINIPDNDKIGLVIAFVEDKSDMVRNNAFGLNPSDYNWPINVTDDSIPNQHTIIVYRNRNTAAKEYYVLYDAGKSDQDTIFNGTSLLTYTPLTNWDTANTETDLRVLRNGDTIHVFTTEFADAPDGKGTLGHEITFLLTDKPELEKFRSGSYFGIGVQSQINAYWQNLFFSDNSLNIYDLRNGNVWTYDGMMYSLDPSKSTFIDIGIRRLWYNPYIGTFGNINFDSSYYIVHPPPNITNLIQAGSNVTVTGLGTQVSPYVISTSGSGGGGSFNFDSAFATKTTTNLAEGSNKYYTDARARAAIALTTTGTSGVATYNSSTGALNIPNYQSSIDYSYHTATYGSTTTINYNSGQKFVLTLTGNTTLAFSNVVNGQTIYILLKQDATGGRTVTLPSNTVFPLGNNTGLILNTTTTANGIDKIAVTYNNVTTNYEVELSKDYGN